MSEQTEGPLFIDVSSTLDVCDLASGPPNPKQKAKTTKKVNLVQCSECTWKGDAETMIGHVRKKHRGENPFQCSMCEYSAYNKTRFQEHVNNHRGVKPYQCSYCPYKSVSKKYVKKHEMRHRPDNPFKCVHCDYIARNSRCLALHTNREHPEQNGGSLQNGAKVPCEYCDRIYTQPEFERHIKSRRVCKICMKKICYQDYYKHMQEKHGKVKIIKNKNNPIVIDDSPEREITEAQTTKQKSVAGSKLFTCALCPWHSYNKAKVLLHLIHHPQQDVNENIYDVSILRRCGLRVGFFT